MPAKVCAYITHGSNLLVFSHPDFPEAGIQVPAGTIEAGETPEAAVMREALEETGLTDLKRIGFLGECYYDMSAWGGDPQQHRYFFHLELQGEALATWRHKETDGGKSEPIVFEFFWAKMPDEIPDLIAGHGQMLSHLFAKQYQNV
ncbi:MAG: hypothetical protein JWL77_5654 [Chthonomonadaceae bacterium]|nr:hypothetical protein [Chthonomonadaceae bacterium]